MSAYLERYNLANILNLFCTRQRQTTKKLVALLTKQPVPLKLQAITSIFEVCFSHTSQVLLSSLIQQLNSADGSFTLC